MKVFNFGKVVNPETNKEADIIVKAADAMSPAQSLIMGVIVGIADIVLCTVIEKAFKKGATAYAIAEYKALDSVGLIKEMPGDPDPNEIAPITITKFNYKG